MEPGSNTNMNYNFGEMIAPMKKDDNNIIYTDTDMGNPSNFTDDIGVSPSNIYTGIGINDINMGVRPSHAGGDGEINASPPGVRFYTNAVISVSVDDSEGSSADSVDGEGKKITARYYNII